MSNSARSGPLLKTSSRVRELEELFDEMIQLGTQLRQEKEESFVRITGRNGTPIYYEQSIATGEEEALPNDEAGWTVSFGRQGVGGNFEYDTFLLKRFANNIEIRSCGGELRINKKDLIRDFIFDQTHKRDVFHLLVEDGPLGCIRWAFGDDEDFDCDANMQKVPKKRDAEFAFFSVTLRARDARVQKAKEGSTRALTTNQTLLLQRLLGKLLYYGRSTAPMMLPGLTAIATAIPKGAEATLQAMELYFLFAAPGEVSPASSVAVTWCSKV